MAEQTVSNQLNQNIEKEVRTLIGDLHVQIIMLRQVMEMQQKASEQQPTHPQPHPSPNPPPQPRDVPPQPTQPIPTPPPNQLPTEPPLDRPEHRVTNGRAS